MKRRVPAFLWWILAPVAVAWVLAPVASGSTEAPPTIDGTTVVATGEHSARIEAAINPHGEVGSYEIWLDWQDPHPPSHGEWFHEDPEPTLETLPAGWSDVTVSRSITGLTPGYAYSYRVYACNRAGETNGKSPYWFGFQTSAPAQEEGGYSFPAETCEIRERHEREIAEIRERHEHEVAEAVANAHAAACRVPALRGKTLRAAKLALVRGHCRLGRVHRPRHPHGTLVVVSQSPRRGGLVAADTPVSVSLRSRR